MEIVLLAGAALITFVVYLNVLTTVSILKASSLSRTQKILQLLFSWLLPIVGAKFVLNILAEGEPEVVQWIPQRGHGWLIGAATLHEALRSRHDGDQADHGGSNHVDGSGGGGTD